MDLNTVRRASSAGYRLPERSNGTRPVSTAQPADRNRVSAGGTGGSADRNQDRNQDRTDPVKQDRVWTQMVRSERRGVREWEKNWSFLRNYDQLGQLKPEQPLPTYVSLFSERIPNTSNQMLGSRLSTPLGSELVRLERLLVSERPNRRKQDPEMLPC